MDPTHVLKSCNPILHAVRSSNLNFTIQETPFSFYLTIRKSFSRLLTPEAKTPESVQEFSVSAAPSDLDRLCLENSRLRVQIQHLEQEKYSLVNDLEVEISNSLSIKAKLEFSETRVNNVQEKFEKSDTEKRILQNSHEKTCEELCRLKSNNKDMSNELNSLSNAVKNVQKELKDEKVKHEKDVSKHVLKIKELEEFKARKCLEEKEFKKQQKKFNQKLKKITEREARLKLDTKDFKHKTAVIDENENEPKLEEEKTSAPLISVSNPFDIFPETEITSDETIKSDFEVEDHFVELNVEAANGMNDHKVEKDIIEEALKKTRAKIKVKIHDSVSEKVKAWEAYGIFTDGDILELEAELMDELELEAKSFIESETESWRKPLDVEFSEGECEGETEHEEPFDDHGFYWGGEDELEILFRH